MQTPTPEQWKHIQEIFAKLLDSQPGTRDSLLNQLTNDPTIQEHVQRMLQSHLQSNLTSFLEPEMLASLAAQVVEDEEVLASGQMLDDFIIIDELGRGGMGVVYRARQLNPKREVAIKVIRPEAATPSVSRRFEHESELLARLSHPGIAQIFGNGYVKVRGVRRPYFAMELVDGIAITQYCKDNAISIQGRLQLIAKVCDATQYAHQKGILHRDIKPSNILVDQSGRPRIIDFGVAGELNANAITQKYTAPGELLGTLVYMSPEQLATSTTIPDTRSDVYALGILAYEILSGNLPFDLRNASVLESIRIIEHSTHTPISQHNKQLAGDIETIIEKAIAKDHSIRYPAASDFAADIRRFLSHQPVLARQPSAIYKIKMYTKRNRTAVLGMVMVWIALLAGVSGVVWQWQQTKQQVAMRDMAFRLFTGNMQSPNIENIQNLELKDNQKFARWLLGNPATDNDQTLLLADHIADSLLYHGDATLSADMYKLALDLSKNSQIQPLFYTERITELYANALRRSGNPQQALDVVLQAEQNFRPMLENPEQWGISKSTQQTQSVRFYKLQLARARCYADLGMFNQSQKLIEELIPIFENLQSQSPPDEQWDVLTAKQALAQILVTNPDGSPDKALKLLQDLYRLYISRIPETAIDSSAQIAILRKAMGLAHLKAGNSSTATMLLQKALTVQSTQFRDDHPAILSAKNALAKAHLANGQATQAEKLFRQAANAYDRQFPNHWIRWVYRADLAQSLIALNNHRQARKHLNAARNGLRLVFAQDDYRLLRVEQLLNELSGPATTP